MSKTKLPSLEGLWIVGYENGKAWTREESKYAVKNPLY
jgi:hypothetical protein